MKEVLILVLIFVLIVDITQAQENRPPVADAGEDVVTVPGKIIIIDGSRSFDPDNNINDSSFSWYEGELLLGNGKVLQKSFPRQGKFFITLKITDSMGVSGIDILRVLVKDKDVCKDTNAVYFPEDTKCNGDWPSKEGSLIFINSQEFSCNLVEICSEELDPIVVDSINCCSGSTLDPKKQGACQFSRQHAKDNAKTCQALYIIKGIGTHAIYMQGYFEAEMCCSAVGSLCKDNNNFYTSRPVPNSKSTVNTKDLRCTNTQDNNPPGYWISDVDITKNNIALSDVPAHVSINKLSTGTCVDFSFAITTLLRKIGYKKDEIYSVETPTHAFNLVKFPLDKKFSVVDTTGTLADINIGGLPSDYNYCGEMTRCFNDHGQMICPEFKDITGCENIEQSFIQKFERIQLQVTNPVKKLINSIVEEAKS